MIASTKIDTTPIHQIKFSDCGKLLFSASHESLKVWILENDKDAIMTDNVESSWRGVKPRDIN